MNVRPLARMVKKTEADAWVVGAGTSEVLEWFMQQKIPVFALYGRRRKLKIAGIGPDIIPSFGEATRRLIELGHQRIVFLDSLYKFSEPGVAGTVFLAALSAGGITAGSYNLPGWDGGQGGFYALLDSLFQHTPPTAIIAGSGPTYFATLHFLLNRGIRVPQDLSLIVFDDDPDFNQCEPSVSHIRWKSSRPVVNRIVGWVNNISEGKEDTRQTTIKAEFVEGGTIGQVPKGKV
jgi:LacI family transcriptional regulator